MIPATERIWWEVRGEISSSNIASFLQVWITGECLIKNRVTFLLLGSVGGSVFFGPDPDLIFLYGCTGSRAGSGSEFDWKESSSKFVQLPSEHVLEQKINKSHLCDVIGTCNYTGISYKWTVSFLRMAENVFYWRNRHIKSIWKCFVE